MIQPFLQVIVKENCLFGNLNQMRINSNNLKSIDSIDVLFVYFNLYPFSKPKSQVSRLIQQNILFLFFFLFLIKQAAIGSDKGDIAILDLSTLGVSQRIPHKENRLSIKSILFPSSSMFVVVECEKRQNTTLRLYSFDNSKEMKWREKSTCYLRNRIICTAFYEYLFHFNL